MYDSKDLRAIVRFEVNPNVFETDNEDEELFNADNYNGTYRPTYQDLKVACENMLKAGVSLVIYGLTLTMISLRQWIML